MGEELNIIFEEVESINYYSSESKESDNKASETVIVEREIEKENTEEKVKVNPSFILNSSLNYLKKNWIFLLSISLIWIIAGSEDYLIPLFNTPVIGKPLVKICLFLSYGTSGDLIRFFTATYNGPVWNMTPFTFLIATVAKAIYLIIITGVIFPSIKAIFNNSNKEINIYKHSIDKFILTIKNITKKIGNLDILLLSLGLSLIISNFLTRNGKFDKAFILMLLAFVLFKGIEDKSSSAIYFIIDKFIRLLTLLIRGRFMKKSNYNNIARIGLAIGFLLAIVVGNLGESASYILGFITLIAAIVAKLALKGDLK